LVPFDRDRELTDTRSII